MILYFNSKIVKDNLTPNSIDSGYFYPIIYPRIENEIFEKEDVLIKTIESYRGIHFTKMYFNIEFEHVDKTKESYFVDLINKIWPDTEKVIKFKRPSNIKDWILETENLVSQNIIGVPVLVVMNHDHPFLEYNSKIFNEIVTRVFNSYESSYKKILYYSHASEYINWSLNESLNLKYTEDEALYKSEIIDNWVDSISIMTFETLLFVWKSIKFEGEYIGRFDWVGVSFNKLGLTAYAYPREFFRHFDGYYHITGSRLASGLNLNTELPLIFPNNSNIDSVISFYYQKWIDLYYFYIESRLMNNIFNFNSKTIFIDAINKSLIIFNKTYIEKDSEYELINSSQISLITYLLKNKIFYNANYIYQDLQTNIQLRKKSNQTIFKLKSIIRHVIKNI